nr:Dihydrofolate reductase [uncultured bacterium]
MTISLILAADENNCIGKNNTLPWHLPADMKLFREKTMGHCVVTGRKNYESIPDRFRPLPGRTNIVITRNKEYAAPGATIVHSLDAGIDTARQLGETEVFVIGGGEIFRQALPIAEQIYLTRIHHVFTGDVFFPALEPLEWKETERHDFPPDERNKYGFSFRVYHRAAPAISESQ